jgi:hypothetical protein
MKYHAIFGAAVLLSACQQSEPAKSDLAVKGWLRDSPNVSGNVAAIVTVDPAQARKMMIELAQLSGDVGVASVHPDSLSHGSIATTTFVGGTVKIYSLPDGRMWQARVLSGSVDHCGKGLSSPEAVTKFVDGFRPEASASAPTLVADLVMALREKRVGKVTFGRATFTASGGCVQSLNYKEDDALPHT